MASWCIGLGAVSAVLGLQYKSYERQAEAAHKADSALEVVAQLANRPLSAPVAAWAPRGPSAEEIRSIVRDELKTATSSAPSRQGGARPEEAPRAEPPPEPPGPSQASLVALTEATRIVDGAITSGRWEEADVQALRRVRGEMSGEQMESVARRLSKAINDQQVKIALSGPMY